MKTDCCVYSHFIGKSALFSLTHKWLETHGWEPNIIATDDLVLKHQGISIYSVD